MLTQDFADWAPTHNLLVEKEVSADPQNSSQL
jgi:hypothetical protein